MPFVEGVVKAADEERPIPPFLLAVVVKEPSGEVLSFSNIAADVLDCIGVFTKQEIDTVAVSLFPGEETTKGCTGPLRMRPAHPVIPAVVMPPGSPSTRKSSMCFPAMRSLLLREGEETLAVVLVLLATSLDLGRKARHEFD